MLLHSSSSARFQLDRACSTIFSLHQLFDLDHCSTYNRNQKWCKKHWVPQEQANQKKNWKAIRGFTRFKGSNHLLSTCLLLNQEIDASSRSYCLLRGTDRINLHHHISVADQFDHHGVYKALQDLEAKKHGIVQWNNSNAGDVHYHLLHTLGRKHWNKSQDWLCVMLFGHVAFCCQPDYHFADVAKGNYPGSKNHNSD